MAILMIIAKTNFRDEEYKIPYKYFLDNKLDVDIASTTPGNCIGKYGWQVEANLGLDEVNVSNYSGIIFIGGSGAKDFIGNKEINRILKEADEKNKVIAAICIAPLILAKAGILEGKRVTVWNEDGQQAYKIEEADAEYVDSPVVIDGKLITANGPKAAKKFAEVVSKLVI